MSLALPAAVTTAAGFTAESLCVLRDHGASSPTGERPGSPQTGESFVTQVVSGDSEPRSGARVGHVMAPRGLSRAELLKQFDVVVAECSCTAAKGFEDEGVAMLCNAYEHRVPSKKPSIAKPHYFDEPGTIAWEEGRAGVVRLYSRWGTGAACKLAPSQPLPGAGFEVRSDSARQRLQWFREGLKCLEEQLTQGQSVAFVWSDEAERRRAIREFARRNAHIRVTVVQTSRSFIGNMTQKAVLAHAEALQTMSQRAHKEARQLPASLRGLALSVCDTIDQILLSSPEEAAMVEGPATVRTQREAVAHVCWNELREGNVGAAQQLLKAAPRPPVTEEAQANEQAVALLANAQPSADMERAVRMRPVWIKLPGGDTVRSRKPMIRIEGEWADVADVRGHPAVARWLSSTEGVQWSLKQPGAIMGLEHWDGKKIEASQVRMTREVVRELRDSSCRWERYAGGALEGSYEWVEEIHCHDDGSLTRAGSQWMVRPNPLADPGSKGRKPWLQVRPPRAATSALQKARGLHYDELHWAVMAAGQACQAVSLMEEAERRRREHNRLCDEQFRTFLASKLQEGTYSARALCTELVGKAATEQLVEQHVHSLMVEQVLLAHEASGGAATVEQVLVAEEAESEGAASDPGTKVPNAQLSDKPAASAGSEGTGNVAETFVIQAPRGRAPAPR